MCVCVYEEDAEILKMKSGSTQYIGAAAKVTW